MTSAHSGSTGMAPASALGDWLREAALRRPDHPALIVDRADGAPETLSYAALHRHAARMAQRLVSAGCPPGARLALWMHNAPEGVELVHAALAQGNPLVPLNARLRAPEVAPLLRAVRPELVIHDERVAGQAERAARESAIPRMSIAELAKRPAERTPHDAARAGGSELILFTSGTTGRPKAARLLESSLAGSVRASATHLALGPDDRWLLCMPLYHIGGLSILLRAAAFGASVVLHARFDEHAVAAALERLAITHVSLVPTMLSRLLARTHGRAPAPLRCVLLGGGPIPHELVERARERGWPIAATYGLTEAASQVATSLPGADTRWLPPLPSTELRVIDAQGGVLPPGCPGEVCVRGPQVMAGYLDPDATARVLHAGWLHTGDVGMLDLQGRLQVLDRRSDLIVSGGENIYPAEVERVLESHPQVAEAGVVGIPDAHWGQRAVAVVRLRTDGTARVEPHSDTGWSAPLERDLREHCAARLAGFKLPRTLVCASEPLPRTASGKLRRDLLRQRIAP